PVTHLRGAALRSGAINAADAFEMVATASAAESTYAGIVKLVETAQHSKAPAVRLADRYAAWFVPLSLVIAGIAWLVSGDPMRALAVVVVATPCPLILAVPVAIVSGISRCARRGILVKDGGALEALAASRTLFFDKTGTLTGGRARLVSIERVAAASEDEVLGHAAALEQMSHHVTATAIVEAARARGLMLQVPTDVVETTGAGLRGIVGGVRVAVGSPAYVGAIVAVPESIHDLLERAAGEGISAVLVAMDGKVAGVLLLADQLRMETPRALRLLRRAGIQRIVMLTGDRQEVADAIGAGLGVDEVLAEQNPADKLAVIQSATRSAPCVMVGDGVNDAPALAAASVGVAMGARGATASAEAAGIVLLVDRLDRLAEALHVARRTRAIAVESVVAGMGLSLVAMVVALFGFLPPIYGAILQELIDVAVILNALRVLRVQPLRASRYGLSPDELGRLHADHEQLAPVLDRLTSVADRLASLRGTEASRALNQLDVMLREQLLPHEHEDDREV
ncbi:MAG: heavy metal translocating P-type ATPase, partial [Proteobacteria bacterium]|nr:heavy metal translocating P-type ATPase [Pseudomonadota bacterium]